MIETQIRTETGMRDVPLQTLLNEHGTVIMQTEAVPCIEGSVVHDFDKSHSRVVMPSYTRNPNLPPAYNMQVDNWLKMMFGDNYHKACEWIGQSLAFEDGPICALSIEGSSGVGKKMFITGLAECLSNPIFGTGDDIVGQYQYNLLSTPFIVVNEGWPKGSHGTHPADSFRSLVAGDTQMVQRKYLPPTKVTSPCRIIFTANNTEVVSMLAGNRDLSPDDREALAIRLLHLRVEDDAARWLRQKGGMRFTVGWIRGDGNVPSRYTVAQHFLWLYENRGEPTGSRFLVEGNSRDELIMFEMRTQSGSSPLVIEAIIAMLESSKTYKGMAVVDAKLYCVPATVLRFYRESMSATTKERMTANIVGKVFAGLRAAEPMTHAKILPGTKERLRWHELDCKLLLSVAQRDGWPCRKLEALVDQQLFEENHALPKGTE